MVVLLDGVFGGTDVAGSGVNMASMNVTEEELTLRGQLSEIARMHAWLEDLAARHGIAANIQFAMAVCLEEVVANVLTRIVWLPAVAVVAALVSATVLVSELDPSFSENTPSKSVNA